MGALKDYDDMMGYEFGEFDEIINLEMLKEFGISGAAGASAILLGTILTQKVSALIQKSDIAFFKTLQPVNRSRLLSGFAVFAGIAGGRGLYHINRDAAAGVAGGLIGLGLANFIGTFFTTNPLGAPLGEVDEDGEGLLSDYDYQTINGLAEAAVEQNDPAFRNLGPMPALAGVNVSNEQLGSYMPYLA